MTDRPLIGVIGAGAMGSGVGRRLVERGARVLTPLEGRSAAARARAVAAGMESAGMGALADARLVLSIVPPEEALTVAEAFAARAGGSMAVFADCNAIDVRTARRVGQVLADAGVRFVDGGIIGLPPAPGAAGPVIYLAGDEGGAVGDLLSELGVRAKAMEGPVGAASALKMSYAGITKGLSAVASIMILGAERAGAGPALRAELEASQSELLGRFGRSLPDMVPKAYRWVAEMREIAAFLEEDPAGAAAFEAFAELYDRIATDALGERREAGIIEGFARGS